jgi:predicted SprT family Zn-dependent metalloprotease
MKRSDAEAIALAAMARIPGWRFEWDSAKRRAGQCRYRSKVISLSVHYVDRTPVEQVYDTILHEVAHALAGHKAGHGPVWVAIARGLGCSAEVHCETFVEGQWNSTCTCGVSHRKFHRKPKLVYICRQCKEPLKYERDPAQPGTGE